MITETSVESFGQNLDDMLSQVHGFNSSIVIQKDGRTIAALVDVRLFVRICRMRTRLDDLSQRLAAGFDGVEADQGLCEIDQVIRGTRSDSA